MKLSRLGKQNHKARLIGREIFQCKMTSNFLLSIKHEMIIFHIPSRLDTYR